MALQKYFSQNFSLDYRSLAAFRMLYGFLLIIDIVNRGIYLEAHYSNNGVVSIEIASTLKHYLHFCLHFLSGESGFITLLFFLQILMALMIVIGYRTKLFVLLSFIFLVSLHCRNSLILDSGDNVLKVMLFWSIFIPIATKFSFDSLLRKNKSTIEKNTISNIGTFAFILQLLSIYIVTGFLKTGENWIDGTAVYYTLQLDTYTTFMGDWLGKQDLLCKFLNYLTLLIEKTFWLLIFIPFKWQLFRVICVAIFMLLHIGFALNMHLGIFPLICIFAWVALLPPLFWDKVLRFQAFNKLIAIVRVRGNNCFKFLFRKRIIEKRYFSDFSQSIKSQIIVCVLLLSVIGWNAAKLKLIDLPKSISNFVILMNLNQSWSMFAPQPYKSDGWYIAKAIRSDGLAIDLFTNSPVSYLKPSDVSDTYLNQRWRKYFTNLYQPKNEKYRGALVRYLRNRYEKQIAKTGVFIETVELVYMREKTLPNYEIPKIDKITLWKYWKDEKYKTNFK